MLLAIAVQVRNTYARQSDSTGQQQTDAADQGVAGPNAFPLDSVLQSITAPQKALPVISAGPAAVDTALGLFNFEPTIAVDPNNPLHIAAATGGQLRVSANGGLSFQPATNAIFPANFGNCGDDSLAYDSQGRLFWTYLGCLGGSNADVFIQQVNPLNGFTIAGPVNISAAIGSPAGPAHFNDKDWLAADATAGSKFQDRLYVVWTDLNSSSGTIRTAFSSNQGTNWSASAIPAPGSEGFLWPTHNTVAPNGDVFLSYHSQPTLNSGGGPRNPNGTSGQVFVLRSANGGTNYTQKTAAYTSGQADITWNVQGDAGALAGADFWIQGASQAWLLADPNTPGRIYCVANDDPDNAHGSGDDAAVFIVISTNSGVNWSVPRRIDDGPSNTFQVMPTAAIDAKSGCIAVHYYDNRRGFTNSSGRFLLDVFAQNSQDGGITFGPAFRVSDAPFDPDLNNTACRWGPTNTGCQNPGPTGTTNRTLRIGEYNGIAIGGGVTFAVWTGNSPGGFQETFFDQFPCVPCVLSCPTNIVANNDATFCGAVVNYPPPGVTGGCGPVNCSPTSGVFYPVGTITVTCSSAANGNCSFTITVNDVEPPVVSSSVAMSLLGPPNHDMVNVGLLATAVDNCDGVLPVTVRVYGNEDDEEPTGDGNFSPDAKDIASGTLRLRQERKGNGSGRVYLIICYAIDAAGNVGFSCSTVGVPQNASKKSIDTVHALAAAAMSYCQTHNGAPPPGYFVVGDGPIIGPKQ
jgi:hypothetical protein